MRTYFAYGSNMDPAQMHARAPGAQFIVVASLEGYKPDFTRYSPRRRCGVMDVVPAKGERVWGVVWGIPDDEMQALDTFESGYEPRKAADRYERTPCRVIPNGDLRRQPVEADMYEVVTKRDTIKPSRRYMETILNGARYWGLPQEYIAQLETFQRSPAADKILGLLPFNWKK